MSASRKAKRSAASSNAPPMVSYFSGTSPLPATKLGFTLGPRALELAFYRPQLKGFEPNSDYDHAPPVSASSLAVALAAWICRLAPAIGLKYRSRRHGRGHCAADRWLHFCAVLHANPGSAKSKASGPARVGGHDGDGLFFI